MGKKTKSGSDEFHTQKKAERGPKLNKAEPIACGVKLEPTKSQMKAENSTERI